MPHITIQKYRWLRQESSEREYRGTCICNAMLPTLGMIGTRSSRVSQVPYMSYVHHLLFWVCVAHVRHVCRKCLALFTYNTSYLGTRGTRSSRVSQVPYMCYTPPTWVRVAHVRRVCRKRPIHVLHSLLFEYAWHTFVACLACSPIT